MTAETDYQAQRGFLKDSIRKQIDFHSTDQARGVPAPPPEKPCPADAARLALPAAGELKAMASMALGEAIAARESRRRFSPQPLRMKELALLLWATQGLRKPGPRGGSFRTVPSAGARHAFESYVVARQVEGLSEGLYRYLPFSHEVLVEQRSPGLTERLGQACFNQTFIGRAAAAFVWTAIPARMEWRYGMAAHKVIAIDVGHVMQNLYLACEAIDCGTCAIAAYDQEAVDELIGVDGREEFAIYLAPVGHAERE